MGRYVRIVELVEADADEVQRRLTRLPPTVTASAVPTGAGVLITLSMGYRATPGSRTRALRLLRQMLPTLLQS